MIEVETTALGGSSLAVAAVSGTVPSDWYAPVPESALEWGDVARAVAGEFVQRDWVSVLAPAFGHVDGVPRGPAAERLARSNHGRGVVVTTGQQPGLFGGPMYTWSKALSALALADSLEEKTGIPVAPVFWAATDDTDFVEASKTVVARGPDVDVLRMDEREPGPAMADAPLGDVSALYARFAAAAGSAVDLAPLHVVKEAYNATQTIGGAYLALLRVMLEPLGISVLDASHPAVRSAGTSLLRAALHSANDVTEALRMRGRAIETAGYRPQVQHVPNLSLVFVSENGERKRVPVSKGARVAAQASDGALGPNVLLRPVMERQILPTVTYIAGPGEFAYFAQVSAVAHTMGVAIPRVVPRWSGRIIEPHVREILTRIHASPDDFRDPHAIESRVARQELPPAVLDALAIVRNTMRDQANRLRGERSLPPALQKSVAGFEAQVEHRVSRLERRYTAAIKRAGSDMLHNVAVARASLFPNGTAQERTLNVIPFLARYGDVVRTEMLAAARQHASAIVGGRPATRTHGAERSAGSASQPHD